MGLIEFESTAGFLHLGLPSSRLLRRHSQQPLLEKRPPSSSISLTIYKIFHLAIQTFHCSICFVDFAFVFVFLPPSPYPRLPFTVLPVFQISSPLVIALNLVPTLQPSLYSLG